MLDTLVSAWEPEFGVVTPAEYLMSEREKQPRPEVPLPGWIIYLSNARGPIPELPAYFKIIPVGSLGHMISATDEPFSHEEPKHIQLAEELSDHLKRAGLLGPISTIANS